MLIAIRERAKGWIAWVIIILIGAAFALFGLSNYMGPAGGSRVVAVVDGQEISPDIVSNAYRQKRAQLEQQLGDRWDPASVDDNELRLDALYQVINEYLLTQFIESKRLKLSDQDLAAVIRAQEMFHEDGRFSSELYHRLLRANRMTSSQYESQVRRAVLMEKLQGAMLDTALVTDREVDRLVSLQLQERELSFLRLPLDAFRETVSVDDDEVREYYEENSGEFMAPERVRLEWLEVRRDDLLDEVDISEEAIRDRYEEVKDIRYVDEETRAARHILVRVDEDADPEAVEDARQRAEALRARIIDGESFAEVAEAESDDPGSARRGGDLGEIERGVMVDEFEEAAFALDEDELSEPVRTAFGFHLIQVSEVRGGEVKAFEDVRDELRRELAEDRVSSLLFEKSRKLDELAFEWPDGLDETAAELGLELRTSDWLTREGASEGIGSHSAVISAAFSEPVLRERQNSELLELDEEHYAVIRIAEHEPEERLAFEEVKDEIHDRLLDSRAADEASVLAETLRDRIRDGESLQALVDEHEYLELEEPGFVTRDANVPWWVLQEAFNMGRPAEGERLVSVTSTDRDGYAVVLVTDVRDGEFDDMSREEKRELRDQLRTLYAEEAMDDFMRFLRAEADIEIFEDRL